MMENSKKRQAEVWFDESTGRMRIELMHPFDHQLFDLLIKKSTKPPERSDVMFDVADEDQTVWGFEFEI